MPYQVKERVAVKLCMPTKWMCSDVQQEQHIAQMRDNGYSNFDQFCCILGWPSTAGSSPLPKSPSLSHPLLSLSMLFPVARECHLSIGVLVFQLSLSPLLSAVLLSNWTSVVSRKRSSIGMNQLQSYWTVCKTSNCSGKK